MLNISGNLASSVIQHIELSEIGFNKIFNKGQMLLWQGDKVDYISVIKSGMVKVYSISADGKVYTYGMLSTGGLVGLPQHILDEESKVMVESVQDTSVRVISTDDFQNILSSDPKFSLLLMKKLVRDLRNVTDKAEEFGFLNVQERLKRSLLKLADEYGIKTDKGICINLNITHKEIGELIGANRTTITYFINQLVRQGYLHKDGKHLILTQQESF